MEPPYEDTCSSKKDFKTNKERDTIEKYVKVKPGLGRMKKSVKIKESSGKGWRPPLHQGRQNHRPKNTDNGMRLILSPLQRTPCVSHTSQVCRPTGGF